MRILYLIPKLPKMSKNKRKKWFLMNFGSGVINSGCVTFIEQ